MIPWKPIEDLDLPEDVSVLLFVAGVGAVEASIYKLDEGDYCYDDMRGKEIPTEDVIAFTEINIPEWF